MERMGERQDPNDTSSVPPPQPYKVFLPAPWPRWPHLLLSSASYPPPLQWHWTLCWGSNVPNMLLPEDMCTGWSRCLKHSSSSYHMANDLNSWFKCHLPDKVYLDHLIQNCNLRWHSLTLLFFFPHSIYYLLIHSIIYSFIMFLINLPTRKHAP